jgi:Domain of unknown function (DUF1707)
MGSERNEIRAADTDRERVVEQLRRHTADGRLTMDEFEERMSAAYAATTYGDLKRLTRDLPPEPAAPSEAAFATGQVDLGALTVPDPRAARREARRQLRAQGRHHHPARPGQRGELAAAASTWFSLSILLTGIWFVSGVTSGLHFSDFWPAWPIGIFGVLVLLKVVKRIGG